MTLPCASQSWLVKVMRSLDAVDGIVMSQPTLPPPAASHVNLVVVIVLPEGSVGVCLHAPAAASTTESARSGRNRRIAEVRMGEARHQPKGTVPRLATSSQLARHRPASAVVTALTECT